MGERPVPSRGLAASLALAAGNVVVAWLVLLAIENVAVGLGYRRLFVAPWEMALARKYVTPIALALLAPAAPLVVLGAWAARGDGGRRALRWIAAAAGVLVGLGVTQGRHFTSWAIRAPFVAVVAVVAFLVARAALPRLAALPRPRLAAAAAAATAAAWLADAFVLPRLYPAFHAALGAITVIAAAGIALGWSHAGRVQLWLGRAGLALALGCVGFAYPAGFGFAQADNLRLVLVERAPLLGRAVAVAARWAPPPPLDDEPKALTAPGEVARSLDWTGRDVVLLSIDALRADHVSAYGYNRPTTPNIDALAAEGARFEAAYCPTPHTSYSVTSMMTGKYMRPLLSLGVGEDSETWAAYARRYGYRTAAFYPPAVFFIDEARFASFRDRGLDFEYRKVEFASPELREEQVGRYLARAPADRPVFLWVHLFEPHEPYEAHPGHVFGDPKKPRDVDLYDGEIAAADAGVGRIVRRVRAARPGAVVIVTADHGEEHGEHGGRYHGTTVYEEQVRVPLVVVGPGVVPRVIRGPVQTIDLLPTVLSALGVPRPPRIVGRDLGPALAGKPSAEPTYAFAETEDYTLVAEGDERLVCRRKLGACALYDVATDPRETQDRSREREARARELRGRARALEVAQGRYEAARTTIPEALRRGLQGEIEAAPDVAALLDDASPEIRRLAAEVCYRQHAPAVLPQLRRAAERDEDEVVRRFASLALVRLGAPPKGAELLLKDPDAAWRRRAALAFAEQGDARGGEGLLEAWESLRGDFETAREALSAIAKTKPRGAAARVSPSLADVRLRPYVVDALGELGDPAGKEPLVSVFANERYRSLREREARALLALGGGRELEAPLRRFAGVPEPLWAATAIAAQAKLLKPASGGLVLEPREPEKTARVTVAAGVARRAIVWAPGDARPELRVRAAALALEPREPGVYVAEIAASSADAIELTLAGPPGAAVWVVPHAPEIPPPPPEKWDGDASTPE